MLRQQPRHVRERMRRKGAEDDITSGPTPSPGRSLAVCWQTLHAPTYRREQQYCGQSLFVRVMCMFRIGENVARSGSSIRVQSYPTSPARSRRRPSDVGRPLPNISLWP